MQQFRNLLRGWLGKVLLFIFILPFAFFGIEGIFKSGSSQDVAMTVNGVEISKMEVSRGIEDQRRNLKQQMGGAINDSFLTDDILRPRVIEGLVQKELIRQAAEKDGLAVSSNLVKSYVRSLPQFQDDKGEFSNDKLEALLVQANFTKARLFDAVQESMVLEQLQSGIARTAFITQPELDYIVRLNGQSRTISFTALDASPMAAGIELTQDELQTYFDAHKDNYRTQEKVKINYVTVDLDSFTGDVKVDEQDVVAAYNEYVAGLSAQERRRASHIMVEVNDDRSDSDAKARIQEVLDKLNGGESFADVAKNYSDDAASAANGGDLDYAGRGVYDPAFDTALFGLAKEGDVSAPVKTEYGYHIIKLTGVERPEQESFDAKKEELTASLRHEKARHKLDEAIDNLNRMAFESGDLQTIAETYNKKVETTPLITQSGGTGIAAEPAFIKAAFSESVVQEGLNSEVIELPNDTIAVLRLAEHQPARDRTLDEVETEVRTAMTQQKVQELAKAKATEIVEKLQNGTDLAAVAAEYGLTWKLDQTVTRQSQEVPRTVISAAFEMPHPAQGAVSAKKVSLPSGNQQIIVLSAVEDGKNDLSAEEVVQATASAGEQLGSQDFNNYVASLKDSAEIEIK